MNPQLMALLAKMGPQVAQGISGGAPPAGPGGAPAPQAGGPGLGQNPMSAGGQPDIVSQLVKILRGLNLGGGGMPPGQPGGAAGGQ